MPQLSRPATARLLAGLILVVGLSSHHSIPRSGGVNIDPGNWQFVEFSVGIHLWIAALATGVLAPAVALLVVWRTPARPEPRES